MLLLLHSAAASAPRRLVDLTPLKGMLLMQRWQASTDARNLVTTIPDGNKLKAVRALQGDELLRRAACKQQFEVFGAATSGLIEADKSAYPQAQRQLVAALRIAGASRGERTQVFASLPLEGGAPSTLALVELGERDWSVLSLCVSPGERRLEVIAEAEAATLQALRARGEAAGLRLRMLATAEASLAANRDALCLVDETIDETIDEANRASPWLYCVAAVDEVDQVPPPSAAPAAVAAVLPLLEWAAARGAYVARALAISPGRSARPRGLVVAEAVEAGQARLGSFTLAGVGGWGGRLGWRLGPCVTGGSSLSPGYKLVSPGAAHATRGAAAWRGERR